jgi:hypothetical protein
LQGITADEITYTSAAGDAGKDLEAKIQGLNPSLKADFGAVGDGVTDDTAAIQAADTFGGRIFVPAGEYLTTVAIDNATFYGDGIIVRSNKLERFPALVDELTCGQEYLVAFHKRVTDGDLFRVKVWGDSRPAGSGTTADFKWHTALKWAARERGYRKGIFENDAVGGSTIQNWIDTHLDVNLDGVDDPHLVVFCAGINDLDLEAATPAQVIDRMDSFLEDIRDTKGYSFTDLSVAVLAPVSAYNPSRSRDPRFIEPLRDGFRRLARKWKCCFVDSYSIAPDASGQAGFGYADDIGSSETIHPNDTGIIPILAQLIDTILPDISPMTGGGLFVDSGSAEPFTAAQLPEDYKSGISILRANPGGGGSNWPLDGFVYTINMPDDIQVQYNFAVSASDSSIYMRKGRSNAWGSWSQLGISPSADVTPNTGYTLPVSDQMRTKINLSEIIAEGYVEVDTPATISAGSTICTVDSDHAPSFNAWGVSMAVWDNTNWEFPKAHVDTSGNVILQEAVTITATRVYFGPSFWVK